MGGFWLPPELWKAVFAIATNYEGEHDIYKWIRRSERTRNLDQKGIDLELARLDVASGYSNNFLLMNDPEFLDQKALRLSLIGVCRNWYDMAIEYLYQSLVIRGTTKIPGCVDALKRNENIGGIVKRFEFNEDEEESEGVFVRQQVSQIIELCPKLLIFAGTVELVDQQALMGEPNVRIRRWLTNHCPDLQHVIGHNILDGFPATLFFRYINSFGNLIALQLPPSIAPMAATEKPVIILPCLRILDIGNQAPLIPVEFGWYLSRWDLPSLDTVHLGSVTRSVALQKFWVKHGKGLHTIKIYNARDDFTGRRLVEANLGIDMPSDILFPNLRQLIILHNAPWNLLSLFLPSRSLEIYEISLTESWPHKSEPIRHLISQLQAQHLSFLGPNNTVKSPNLRHVRISRYPFDADAVGGKRLGIFDSLESVCEQWEKLLMERGVSLEKIRMED